MATNDFLQNYLIYCEGNEVPPSYHRWAGISALSTLVSRRVWMDFGLYQDHCNMYIVLVGKPADKKSTAMGIARRLIQQCGVKIAPSSTTKQRIYELLDSKNEKLGFLDKFEHDGVTYPMASFPMFCNEMVTMLSAGGDPLGMIEFLTDIWNVPFFDTDTKNAGSNVIVGPYITILGCMTPDQTGSLMKQDIITGGFSRRCIIITPDKKADPVAFPEIHPHQEEAWRKCVAIGHELRNVKGPFTFSQDARVVYTRWYNANADKQHGMESPAVLYFLGSLPRYVAQVSMLLSLSRDRQCRVVDVPTLETAIAWLEPLKNNLSSVFAGAGSNPLANVSAKIESLLERAARPMTRKSIHAAIWDHADAQQFEAAMKFLQDAKKVKELSSMVGGQLVIQYCLPDRPADLVTHSDHRVVHMSSQDTETFQGQMPSDDPLLGIDLTSVEIDAPEPPTALLPPSL